MSQFRIKNIDNFIPDEWVYKLNDGASIVGDDIDARDPNELADAIFDTQTLLLKVSSLPSNTIIKPHSGLAERITILESIAGSSTLQDIYSNGNVISLLPSKPLIFGTREEFKLDDAGNLSFKPVTMKVRGNGFQTLDLTSYSVTTNLGDLLVGATSPSAKLTLRAEENIYFKDIFLTNPITLSEPSNTALITTSQSLVGAINELKRSSFSTSFQDVYSQSTPPKLITNATQGALVIEDPNNLSTADALRVAGILNVTKRAKVGDLRVGINTSIADSTGYISSDPIKTTNRVETPTVTSGSSELTFTDRRVSFPFSDNSVSGLLTNRKSVIGAINELKTDITTVGGASILFNAEHDPSTGFHKIITTQAEIGQNATKRIVVKNQMGEETFSVNGTGEVIAAAATIAGLSISTLLNQLQEHLTDSGTSHSAFASHLADSNPHNTVKSIMSMSGDINLSSVSSNLQITSSGNSIIFDFINTLTLQEAYQNLPTAKVLTLEPNGLVFNDQFLSQIFKITPQEIINNKDLIMGALEAKVTAIDKLEIKAKSDLKIISEESNIEIDVLDSDSQVIIQNIPFGESGAGAIPPILGSSILGALKRLGDDFTITLENNTFSPLSRPYPYFAEKEEIACAHIPDLHPANEYLEAIVPFYWANKGALFYPLSVGAADGGDFFATGKHLVEAGIDAVAIQDFQVGGKLYPIRLSYVDVNLTNIAGISTNIKLKIGDNVEYTGQTGTVEASLGHFRIEQTGNDKVRLDKTRNNLINTINNSDYIVEHLGTGEKFKAGIWGTAPKAYVTIDPNGIEDGTIFQINAGGHPDVINVTFTASETPSGLTQFLASENPTIVAESLAEAINRTTFKESAIGNIGHKCKAIAKGALILIEFYMPGVSGELITFSAGTGISYTQMTGGQCSLRIYDVVVENNTPYLVSILNGIGMSLTASTFFPKEKTDAYFLTAGEALSSKRNAPYYIARELGSVEAISDNIISFRIKE